jgi:hypothetical protein
MARSESSLAFNLRELRDIEETRQAAEEEARRIAAMNEAKAAAAHVEERRRAEAEAQRTALAVKHQAEVARVREELAAERARGEELSVKLRLASLERPLAPVPAPRRPIFLYALIPILVAGVTTLALFLAQARNDERSLGRRVAKLESELATTSRRYTNLQAQILAPHKVVLPADPVAPVLPEVAVVKPPVRPTVRPIVPIVRPPVGDDGCKDTTDPLCGLEPKK